MTEAMLYAIALVATGAKTILFVYFIITLSDLECDYLNSQQCCSRLNVWILPKLGAHIFIILLLLYYSQIILVLANLPLAVWLFYEYYTVPKGNMGIYDPTEIHNRGQLKKHMRDSMINLGYYLLFFFIYLYYLIISLLKANPLERPDPVEANF